MDLQNKLRSLRRSQVLRTHNLWSCCARVSATLQVFTPEWFLMAPLVDRGSLEMCGICTECSRCVVRQIGEEEECSWRKVRERTTVDETCDTPDDDTYFGHTNACKSRLVLNLSLPKRIECAVRACDQTVLHRCVLWVGVLSTHPVDFLEFLPGNRNHHHLSDVVYIFSLPSSFLCQPTSRLQFYPTHFRGCAISTNVSILCGFLNFFSSFLFKK